MQTRLYTLPEKLIEVVEQYSQDVAIQIKKGSKYDKYTFQDIYDNAQKVMNALLHYGINKDDRIIIMMENRPEWSFIYFGILFAGAIAIPVDPQSTVDNLIYYCEDSDAKIIFTSNIFSQLWDMVSKNLKIIPKIIMLDSTNTNDYIIQYRAFVNFQNNDSILKTIIERHPNDIASILYTSGTTGNPKGVMLSHENFYSNFRSIEKSKLFDLPQNFLSVLPLHHSFPFLVTLITPIFSHNKVTYVSSLKKEELMSCMQETGITIFVGVPQFFYSFYQNIINEINKISITMRLLFLGLIKFGHNIRYITGFNINKFIFSKIHQQFGDKLIYFVSGGAKLDENVEIFLNQVGFTIIQGYGLTETSPIVTFNPIEKQKIGSVGQSIPDVKIKICNPDYKGIGEVIINGPNIMQGYFKQPIETNSIIIDGWLHSGDLGYIDQQGYLFLTGRKKELIKLSTGKYISPDEVERQYLKSSFIKEMCVFTVGNGEKEKLVAVIVPDFDYFKKTGEIDVYEIIKLEIGIYSKDYPIYKRILNFIVSKDQLPRTNLGKLKRYLITNKYTNELLGIKQKHTFITLKSEDLEIVDSDIFKTVIALITKEKTLDHPIQLTDHLGMDLAFDSLDRVELLAKLEKQFNIDIPEKLIAEIATIKELIIALNSLIKQQKFHSTQSIMYLKQNLWQDLLQSDPTKTITSKIDLSPSTLSLIIYNSFCKIFHFLTKFIWRTKIIGSENIPIDGPCIICPNHCSFLDAFLILPSLPKALRSNIFFLGYHIYFDITIIRNFIKLGRIIPLDPAANLVDSMRACGYVLRHGKTICLFPEGNISPDGKLLPFKKGVGVLAKELNIPLIPTLISGAFEALPRGNKFPRFNKIKIIFGKQCYAEDLQLKVCDLGITDEYEAIAKGLSMEINDLQKYVNKK